MVTIETRHSLPARLIVVERGDVSIAGDRDST